MNFNVIFLIFQKRNLFPIIHFHLPKNIFFIVYRKVILSLVCFICKLARTIPKMCFFKNFTVLQLFGMSTNTIELY